MNNCSNALFLFFLFIKKLQKQKWPRKLVIMKFTKSKVFQQKAQTRNEVCKNNSKHKQGNWTPNTDLSNTSDLTYKINQVNVQLHSKKVMQRETIAIRLWGVGTYQYHGDLSCLACKITIEFNR